MPTACRRDAAGLHRPHRTARPSAWPDDRLTVAWLGHATVLLNFYGTWILTDPALERRIGIGRGLVKWARGGWCSPRSGRASCRGLDLLLLSHAHMDHTDLGTLRASRRDAPVVVQPATVTWFAASDRWTSSPGGRTTDLAGVRSNRSRSATGVPAW